MKQIVCDCGFNAETSPSHLSTCASLKTPLPAELIEEVARGTERLTRELDITNADHIAIWLEANTIPDEPMSQCISWLACRIVEAHEAALSTPAMREALVDVTAHLVAAHSLLSRSPKTAAPSNKMFDQMLRDYAKSIERGRAALSPKKEDGQ